MYEVNEAALQAPSNLGIVWWAPILYIISFIILGVLSRTKIKYTYFVPIIVSFISIGIFITVFSTYVSNNWERYGCDIIGVCWNGIDPWFVIGDIKMHFGAIIDGLTVTMLGLITIVGSLVIIYSVSYMHDDPRKTWYFSCISFFIAAMLFLVLANNLLLIYVAWELVGLGSYLLIGFWYGNQTAVDAAKKAFITTRIGDVGLMVGILILGTSFTTSSGTIGTFHIPDIILAAQQGMYSTSELNWGCLLIFLGAMGKSAQFPLHIWLPDAMEGPTPVSALIHAATMVTAGIYLTARLFPLYEISTIALTVVTVIGLITAIIAASMALVMNDLKKILAYSTVSHLGLMIFGIGTGGYAAAMLHLVAHGFSKALLFLSAGNIMHSLHEETDIRKMGNLRHYMPITTICFLIGALSLSGIPPLSGYFSKDMLLHGVTHGKIDFTNIYFLLSLGFIFLSSLYMTRVFILVFWSKSTTEYKDIHEAPKTMNIPIIILTFFSIVFGIITCLIYQDTLLDIMHLVTWGFLDTPLHFEFDLILTILSVGFALSGIIAGYFLYQENYVNKSVFNSGLFKSLNNLISQKYYLDDAYNWIVSNVVNKVTAIVSYIDRAFVNDIGINSPGEAIRATSNKLRYIQTGKVYNYALFIVLSISVIVLIWIFLETGKIL